MHWGRITFWSIVAAFAGIMLFLALRTQPVWVEPATAERGPLDEVIIEEGETRVQDRYVVSAPVSGYLRRVELKVGDPVEAEQRLTELEPLRSAVLDARSRAEARARIAAAKSALESARQQVNVAAANEELARSELARVEKLAEKELVSSEKLEQARAEVQRSEAALRSARFNAEVARYELQAAQTRLDFSADGNDADRFDLVTLRAPVSGAVLQVMRESEGVVNAGQPVVEIGNPEALEVVVDVLSFDAVKLSPGTPVRIHGWGGPTLDGVVRLVEPVGFTQVSALGVEEQRVRVIVDIRSPREQWRELGDGYRVDASFVLWQGEDVLLIPLSAVFERQGGEYVFVIEDNVARLRQVETGHSDGFMVEVVSGLEAGERVVRHTGNQISDGVPLALREVE